MKIEADCSHGVAPITRRTHDASYTGLVITEHLAVAPPRTGQSTVRTRHTPPTSSRHHRSRTTRHYSGHTSLRLTALTHRNLSIGRTPLAGEGGFEVQWQDPPLSLTRQLPPLTSVPAFPDVIAPPPSLPRQRRRQLLGSCESPRWGHLAPPQAACPALGGGFG